MAEIRNFSAAESVGKRIARTARDAVSLITGNILLLVFGCLLQVFVARNLGASDLGLVALAENQLPMRMA